MEGKASSGGDERLQDHNFGINDRAVTGAANGNIDTIVVAKLFDPSIELLPPLKILEGFIMVDDAAVASLDHHLCASIVEVEDQE